MNSASDCIFCKIAAAELPAKIVYDDDGVIAIEDAHPASPTHLLVMPKRHYADMTALVEAGDVALTDALLRAAAQLGGRHGGENGFRMVVNSGRYGGQTINHLHLHVLAGRPMGWPPG